MAYYISGAFLVTMRYFMCYFLVK